MKRHIYRPSRFPIAAPGPALVRRGRKAGSAAAYYNVGNVGNAGSAGKCRDRGYRRAAAGAVAAWTNAASVDPQSIHLGHNLMSLRDGRFGRRRGAFQTLPGAAATLGMPSGTGLRRILSYFCLSSNITV